MDTAIKRFPNSSRDLYGMDYLKAYLLENSEL